MTVDQARSTNGSGPAAGIGARPARRVRRQARVRLRKLLVPVLLLFGLLMLLRHFEQATAD